MKKIFKYTLKKENVQYLNLPEGAQILSVEEQDEEVVLYAIVEPDKPLISREVRIYVTGHDIMGDDIRNLEFMGTVKLLQGKLMFHVFVDIYRVVQLAGHQTLTLAI